jgi:hypothetical protein
MMGSAMNGNDWLARRMEARRKGRFIGWIIVAALAFVVVMGAAVNALLAGIGVIHDSSEPVGAKTILIAVAFFAISVLCAGVAVHFEHRLRGAPPGRISSGLSAAQASLPAGRRLGRRRRYSPTSLLISGVVTLGLGIAFAVVAFGAHSAASKSSYTQSNGVQDVATVDSVSNYQSTGRSSTSYWATVAATLQTPVDGHRATEVNIPNNVNYQAGRVISVVVDPADPGYSEMPGSPDATDGTTAGAAIGAVVFVIAGIGTIVSSFRMRARLRAHRMQAASTMPAAFGDAPPVSGPEPGQDAGEPATATEPDHRGGRHA